MSNQLGLTEKQLDKVFKQLEGVESPDSFPMSPELSRLLGQFEGLIEALGNTLTVKRDDGAEITYTRRLSQRLPLADSQTGRSQNASADPKRKANT